MGEPTKDELVEDARDAGVPEPEQYTKPELKEQLDARAPAALGPVIPEGSYTGEAPKSTGKATAAAVPQTVDEIPEAGR